MSLIKTNGGIAPILETRFPELLSTNFPELFSTNNFFDTPFFKREWRPAANVKDNEDSYEIELASPGLSKEDFKVSIEDGVLTISSEKEVEKSEESETYSYKEFNYNSFCRSFSLPKDIKEEEISAKYDDGILRVTLQKEPVVVHENVKEIPIS